MKSLRLLAAAHGLDALIVLAAVTSAVGTALRHDSALRSGPGGWFEVAAIAVVVLALLLRRRFPFWAPATVWISCPALSFLDGELVPSQPAVFVAGLGAALLLGMLRDDVQAILGLALVLGGSAVVVSNLPGAAASTLILVPLQCGLGWLVGFALRAWNQRTDAAEARASLAERDREAVARIAVAEERTRIARELHDVVAHAVSVMVLQVGAVRHRMAAADTENRDALRSVEEAGRAALAEMRRLLGAMREGEAPGLVPHAGLAQLDALVSDVRAAGLAVRLELDGEPLDLPPALDLSAYRIVQEALTNVLKHAHAQRAEVLLRYDRRDLEVEVRDDGRGALSAGQPGHGLVGIAERVRIYGGDLSVGPGAGGGFQVHARLPVNGAR